MKKLFNIFRKDQKEQQLTSDKIMLESIKVAESIINFCEANDYRVTVVMVALAKIAASMTEGNPRIVDAFCSMLRQYVDFMFKNVNSEEEEYSINTLNRGDKRN